MYEADVARIEEALGHLLPSQYRDFLIHYGDELREINEALPFRAVLWWDADDVIRENLMFRRHAADLPIASGRSEQPWPDYFLVIGTNGGGDYWFIHREALEPAVLFWDHETHRIEQRHGSLARYLAELRREMEAPEPWQQRPPG
jgi:hypothetical protein